MPSTFPASDFDDPDKLLALAGGYWAEMYAGNDPLRSLLYARARRDEQAHLDFAELLAAVSRFTVPVFHRENWHLLRLLASQRGAGPGALAKFGPPTGLAFGEPTGLAFDVAAAGALTWPIPAGLTAAAVVLDRAVGPTVTWTAGVDFVLDPAAGVIAFRADPFAAPGVAQRPVLDGGVEVDRECALWVYAGAWDWATVYRQFGYALGLRLRSSARARDLVNAVFDAIVRGTTRADIEHLFAAAADTPLAARAETVEAVFTDDRHLWVVTPAEAYRCGKDATPLVAAGDAVRPGDPLTDAVRVDEFNRGAVPAGVRALPLGPGLIAAAYFQDLVFEDADVPLVVETVGGRTKVSFAVGGWPADVDRFWDELHAKGVAAGQTLANLLDVRPDPAGEPGAASLPATVNPLKFLAANVLRNNFTLVRLRPRGFGADALGVGAARVLRKVVPPATCVVVLVELDPADAPVTMDGAGSDAGPGCEERTAGFVGARAADDIDPEEFVAERVRLRSRPGHCA